jgi:hypothetical protein
VQDEATPLWFDQAYYGQPLCTMTGLSAAAGEQVGQDNVDATNYSEDRFKKISKYHWAVGCPRQSAASWHREWLKNNG